MLEKLKELKQRLFLPHYVANLLFILPYLIIRYILPYDYLDLSIEPPEKRIYMIFAFLIAIKYKTTGNAEEFLSITFIYGKLFNIIMFVFYKKFYLFIFYIISWFALYVLLPQPSYQGPSKIIEITEEDLNKIQINRKLEIFGNQSDDDENEKDSKEKKGEKGKEVDDKDQDREQETFQNNKSSSKDEKNVDEEDEYWIIFCYVPWSNVCRNFEPTVAETSLKYAKKNIHFAKIDLEKYPEVADEYNISLSPSSFDLPTLLLLKNGDLINRLPQDPKFITDQNEQLKQLKSPLIKNIKVTWDRLGWGRDMKSIIETFKLESIYNKNNDDKKKK